MTGIAEGFKSKTRKEKKEKGEEERERFKKMASGDLEFFETTFGG